MQAGILVIVYLFKVAHSFIQAMQGGFQVKLYHDQVVQSIEQATQVVIQGLNERLHDLFDRPRDLKGCLRGLFNRYFQLKERPRGLFIVKNNLNRCPQRLLNQANH